MLLTKHNTADKSVLFVYLFVCLFVAVYFNLFQGFECWWPFAGFVGFFLLVSTEQIN